MRGRSLIVAAALAIVGCGSITPLAGTPDAAAPAAPGDGTSRGGSTPAGQGPQNAGGGAQGDGDNGAGTGDHNGKVNQKNGDDSRGPS